MSRSKTLAVLLSILAGSSEAWVVPHPGQALASRFSQQQRSTTATSSSRLFMALDYNDPIVAEEFAKVQPMPFEEVEEELMEKGIPVPASMNEYDVKLMLVEMRLRFAGKLKGQTEKKRPDKFSSKWEEAMWTKPAFEEFYNTLKKKDDHNAMNVICEYLNNKDQALQRYGKDYRTLIKQCEEALNAPPPVKSPTLKFSGFPANMGEDACRMTLAAIGELVDFECAPDEDFPVLAGKVTFEDIECAKKAVAQYNGMDMGMGTQLELVSI